MLLLGDGEKSLDRLRTVTQNNNHGLKFLTNVTDKTCANNLEILANSFVEVKDRGFFNNWYSTLPKQHYFYALKREINAYGSQTSRQIVGQEILPEFSTLQKSKPSILELLTYIPDLNDSLIRYGVNKPSSRLDYEITANATQESEDMVWRIHGAANEQHLLDIVSQFEINQNSSAQLQKNFSDNKLSCIVTLKTNPSDLLAYPSFRETINNEKIVYPVKFFERHELVDAFLSSYGLSMLSRYYPDLWVQSLESHCKATKMIEKLVRVLIKKTPLMTLSLMHGDDYVISNHRPHWHL